MNDFAIGNKRYKFEIKLDDLDFMDEFIGQSYPTIDESSCLYLETATGIIRHDNGGSYHQFELSDCDGKDLEQILEIAQTLSDEKHKEWDVEWDEVKFIDGKFYLCYYADPVVAEVDPVEYRSYYLGFSPKYSLADILSSIERLRRWKNNDWNYIWLGVYDDTDDLVFGIGGIESDSTNDFIRDEILNQLPNVETIDIPKIGCWACEFYNGEFNTYKIIEHSDKWTLYDPILDEIFTRSNLTDCKFVVVKE